jgi:ABC-type polysaccharide/polyol phosphate export permease
MKCGRLADFFFVGLAVLPVTLLFGGYPELAVMLFVPLLLAACLLGGIARFEDVGQDAKEGERDPRE